MNGIKGISVKVGDFVPIAFEIHKNNGFKFCVTPNSEILDLEDIEIKNQMVALWATKMSKELNLPTRFWIEGDKLLFEPNYTEWKPVD